MKTLLLALRDPIWASIGVLATLVTVFLNLPSNGDVQNELALVRFSQFRPVDLPKELALIEKSLGTKLANLHEAYYLVYNRGTNFIQPTDFWEPIRLRSKRGTIALASPCVVGMSFTVDHVSIETNAPSTTSRKGSDWEITTTGLNPDDVACVLVYVQLAKDENTEEELVEISARVKGSNVKYYSSLTDLPTPSLWSTKNIFNIGISLVGQQVYWFVILQAIIFFLTYQIAHRAGVLTLSPLRSGVGITLLAVLSSSSAENFIALQKFELRYIHPALWVTFAIHLIILVVLVARARSGAKTTAVSPNE